MGVKVQLNTFVTCTDEFCDQIHTLAALLPKTFHYPSNRRLEDKNVFTLPGIKL